VCTHLLISQAGQISTLPPATVCEALVGRVGPWEPLVSAHCPHPATSREVYRKVVHSVISEEDLLLVHDVCPEHHERGSVFYYVCGAVGPRIKYSGK